MLIFTKITDLLEHLRTIRSPHLSIGFVPTMGALHEGHISLVKISKQACDVTICSIFVNPTQFNDKKDLENYPRMPEEDLKMLKQASCDVVFMPATEEMYNEKESMPFDFGYLDKILEGRYRPGHFAGVAQVVQRFLMIVQPDKAFFGRKDFQQVKIVKELVRKMGINTEIIACPTVREADGLAMSSRNLRLNTSDRKTAGRINVILMEASQVFRTRGNQAAHDFVQEEASKLPNSKLDYFEICDAETLLPLEGETTVPRVVLLIAIYVGEVRLIDNLEADTF